MFKDYESKPITRSAHLIVRDDVIHRIPYEEATYTLNGKLKFKAHETVLVGDYIVRITLEDTYHCSAEVFEERNIT